MLDEKDLAEQLKKANLRYFNSDSIGFERKGAGKGFTYLNLIGQKIKDEKTLERIKKLRIPPAWKSVWICPSENGHIQATGIDEKGRKQYIYHEDWIRISQEDKFNKLLDFGKFLPTLRNQIASDMLLRGLKKNKVVAVVVWLLEKTFIRIGNEEYAKENQHFGLTTLRNKHVDVKGADINFEFKGKSGVMHNVHVNHPAVAKIIKQCTDLPGYEIFQFIDEEGVRHSVDSEDVNEYLKIQTGQDVTAKDFRTWGGSYLSATTLCALGQCEDEKTYEGNIKEAVKKVSSHLRNTTKVCKQYYIHPTVFDTYQKHILIPHFASSSKLPKKFKGLTLKEYLLLSLIEQYPYHSK